MTKRQERSIRMYNLFMALREGRLASIRDDLAEMGHPDVKTITAHYVLSPTYKWPLLTKLDVDGQNVADLSLEPRTPFAEDFAGSDTQHILNALLIEDYDPDVGDSSIEFDFQNLSDEVPLQATACLKSSVSS
jgi:hypothetical protein